MGIRDLAGEAQAALDEEMRHQRHIRLTERLLALRAQVVIGDPVDVQPRRREHDMVNTVQFQINGRDVDANDIRGVCTMEDDVQIVVLVGGDGVEYYAVDGDGAVTDIGGMDWTGLLDHYHDLVS
jgi:hypothetical protein